MNISDFATKQLIDEFINSNVYVLFSNKYEDNPVYMSYVCSQQGTEKLGSESKMVRKTIMISKEYRPFSITINGKFSTSFNDPFEVHPDYSTFIDTLFDKVIAEIDQNINLRASKWGILNYLTNLNNDLTEIKNNFISIEVGLEAEEAKFKVYFNSNSKIETQIETQQYIDFSKNELAFRDLTISKYWEIQLAAADRLLKYIKPRKKVIETTDDYVKVIDILPEQRTFRWKESDTDLLELIIAIFKSGAIQNSTKDLTQDDAIKIFSDFFGKEIKYSYKKLNAARNRKKEDVGFIDKMQNALESYYQELRDKK